MKNILFQSIKLLALFTLSYGIVMYAKDNLHIFSNNRVDAAGALTFNIGVPNGQPIFTFSNIAPGFTQTKTISANNGDSVIRTVGVKGIPNSTGKLNEALLLTIKLGNTTVYGPHTLKKFFEDSQSLNGVVLSNVPTGGTTEYDFSVTFDTQSGNEYQNLTTNFDLTFGIVTEIPLACEGIKFANTIYGTAGNDTINGTNKNDLIIALDGNDNIDSGVGNDCIVAGAGNDVIDSGVGNDIVDAGDGNDRVDAGVGKDYVLGGPGDDFIEGGVGDDEIYAGIGNDEIYGGVGKDEIYGEDGNDTMIGDVGNDTLMGGDGSDSADGSGGKDTCVAEIKISCER